MTLDFLLQTSQNFSFAIIHLILFLFFFLDEHYISVQLTSLVLPKELQRCPRAVRGKMLLRTTHDDTPFSTLPIIFEDSEAIIQFFIYSVPAAVVAPRFAGLLPPQGL